VGDQPVGEQTLDDAVERSGAETYFAAGAKFHFFQNRVTMQIFSSQCEQNVKHGWTKRFVRVFGFGHGVKGVKSSYVAGVAVSRKTGSRSPGREARSFICAGCK